MKLSIRDNKEIEAIIASLSEGDKEIIADEVERLAELKRANPIMGAISGYEPSEFTALACEWLDESDSEYQVKVSEVLWDLLTFRVTREYALNIFRNRHSFDEVA